MYELECLTQVEGSEKITTEECSPLYGMCYPDVEGCCGPDCSPN